MSTVVTYTDWSQTNGSLDRPLLCEPEQVTISLALSLVVCKMAMLVIPSLQDCWRREWDDGRKRI